MRPSTIHLPIRQVPRRRTETWLIDFILPCQVWIFAFRAGMFNPLSSAASGSRTCHKRARNMNPSILGRYLSVPPDIDNDFALDLSLSNRRCLTTIRRRSAPSLLALVFETGCEVNINDVCLKVSRSPVSRCVEKRRDDFHSIASGGGSQPVTSINHWPSCVSRKCVEYCEEGFGTQIDQNPEQRKPVFFKIIFLNKLCSEYRILTRMLRKSDC